MRLALLPATLAPLVLALPAAGQQTHRFFPPGAAAYGGYGGAVALDGGFALVGAPGGNGLLDAPGVVHVHLASSGRYFGALRAAPPGAGDDFGEAVRAGGGLALVGAPGDDGAGPGAGAAYVFDIATGSQLRRLVASDVAAGDRFGASVEIRDGLALVCAPLHDGVGTHSGAAYLFDLATGQELVKYVGTEPGEELGSGCAMNDDHVLLGAWKSPVNGMAAAGSAYLFERDTGQLVARFVAPQPAPFRYYGNDVALNDDLLAIAHSLEGNGFVASGVVYVHELATLQQVARLQNPQLSPDNFEFGSAVDMDHSTLVVGAQGNVSSFYDAGTVHRFDLPTILQVPPPQTTLRAEPSGSIARFGRAVAVEGARILGGNGSFSPTYPLGAAFLFGPAGTSVGTASCFGLACPCGNDQALPVGCTNSSGRGALLTGVRGGSVAEDGLVLVTEFLPANAPALVFMGDALLAPAALGDGGRCVGGSLFRFGPPLQATADGTAVLGSAVAGAGIVAYSCVHFGPAGCIQAGTTWHFQTWYRDPAGPCATGSNLSNALSVPFGP